jgi:hypothetical protein
LRRSARGGRLARCGLRNGDSHAARATNAAGRTSAAAGSAPL